MDDFYGVFIIAGVLAVQYFFSTRNSIYWGGIVPVAYIVFLTWLFITNRIESIIGFILILLLGMLFLIIEWSGVESTSVRKQKKN
ncbi:hypothetical protein [Niallia nealsonii]|uniref:hypothetical protein n=1 Tax=Niallia nealsonii TaxID=115979 RepID=UPI002694A4A7